MAYNILNTDGTTLLILADGTIDQAATSLTLIGKNYSGFGEAINNNFVKLLENSASANSPRSPQLGQTWYDTTNQRLMVYDTTFKSISGATVDNDKPNLAVGDFWFDSTNEQLKIKFNNTDNNPFVIGPLFPASVGENGWILPTPTVLENITNSAKNITLLKNYGNTIGYVANEKFDIKSTSTYTYLITGTTTATVKGLTILGDIQYTGKLLNRYLSASVDFKNLTTTPAYQDLMTSNTSTISSQTWAISLILENTFTINTTNNDTVPHKVINISGSETNTKFQETGVPPYSQARVICSSSVVNPGVYQIRLFEAQPDGNWVDKAVESDIIFPYTATNVISEFSTLGYF